MNPYDQKHIKRLLTSKEWSVERLIPFKREYVNAVNEACPTAYGKTSTERRPFNLLALAKNIHMRQLIAQYPQVLAETTIAQLKEVAQAMQADVNFLINKLKLKHVINSTVLDALFCMGVAQVAQEPTPQKVQTAFGETQRYVPYAQHVCLDDWFHDMTAKSWQQLRFCGHQYCLPYSFVMESDLYENTASLKPNYDQAGQEKRASDLSTGRETPSDEYADDLLVEDFWLPSESLLLTIPCGKEQPIRIVEWDGSDAGPYHILSYSDVPSNLMPAAPIQYWRDLNDLANQVFNKLADQALREKTITGVQDAAASDAVRFVDAHDGDVIKMQFPEKMQAVKSGGVNAASLAFELHIKDMFSYLAGNLDSLGGLQRAADTVGQENIITQSASAQIAEMGDRTEAFVAQMCESLAFFRFADPLLNEKHQIPSEFFKGATVPLQYSSMTRMGNFSDFQIKIEPYSMRHQSPEQHSQSLSRYLAELVPFLPLLQQQGGTLNFQTLSEIKAKLDKVQAYTEIFEFGQPVPEEGVGVGSHPQTAMRSANTTRTNVRVSKNDGSGQRKQEMANLMKMAGAA